MTLLHSSPKPSGFGIHTAGSSILSQLAILMALHVQNRHIWLMHSFSILDLLYHIVPF
jgi:hypothetical protein